MALYTRIQFAELCGVSRGYINMAITRKNVMLTEDGKHIDDSESVNNFFLEKRQANKKETKGKKTKSSEDKKSNLKSAEPEKEKPKHNSEEATAKFNLSLKVTEADVKKKEIDIRIAELREQKLRGEVIPTDVVKLTIAGLFKNVTSTFKNVIENMLIEVDQMAKLSPEQKAKLRTRMIVELNNAIDDTIVESKRSIKNIITEYSEKKEVGERS